jgi:hypothetical protein
MMPPDQIVAWAVAANTFITLGTAVYTFLTARASKALSELAAIRTELEEMAEKRRVEEQAVVARFQLIENRVQSIDGELKHMPDISTTNDLKLSLAELTGVVNTQAEVTNGVARSLRRLEDYLLEKGK